MDWVMQLSAEYGALVVFCAVLIGQLGVPIPASAVLLLTGGMAAHGSLAFPHLLGAAVLACVVADGTWYLIGMRFGRRVLGMLCRVSLTPESCVRQTESIYTRWGAPSLLVAKFVPGFASVATALAGAVRLPPAPFLFFDTLGATLWAGVGLGIGLLFSDAVGEIMQTLARLGEWGLVLLAAAPLVLVLRKWWQRHSFNRLLRMDRVSVAELIAMIDGNEAPMIVDARSPAGWAAGRIPGAVAFSADTSAEVLRGHPKDALVVVYCACPNDASAVVLARKLMQSGFTHVRPLAGGLDAWTAAEGRVER